jgi:hypothetical protein
MREVRRDVMEAGAGWQGRAADGVGAEGMGRPGPFDEVGR